MSRFLTIAIGTSAIAVLGGVSFAAAHSVDATPPPAYIPSASSVADSSSSVTVTTVGVDTSSLVGSLPETSAPASVTVTSVDDHGGDGVEAGDDHGGASGSGPGTSTATTAETTFTSVDDHGGHGTDDGPGDDHGGSVGGTPQTSTAASPVTTTATSVDDHGGRDDRGGSGRGGSDDAGGDDGSSGSGHGRGGDD